LIPKRTLAIIVLVLLVVSMGLVSAHIYSQQTSYVSQTIKNRPNYYVNQLSNVDSFEDEGVHSNFTAQQFGPDSSFDNLSEESVGEDTGIEDFVDNDTSDVDNSADVGSHGNFSAQQYGPDAICDTLTEEDQGGGLATFGKTDVGATAFGFTGYLEASRYQCGQEGSVTKITLCLSGGAIGRYARVAIYSDNSGAPSSLLGQSSQQEIGSNGWYDFTGFNVSVSKNAYYWLAFQISTSNLQYHYDGGQTNQHAYRVYAYGSFPSYFGLPSYTAYAQSIYATSFATNYELDLEVQFSNIVDFLPANELCIYTGAFGSEDLRVDYWTGIDWENLATDLTANSWNNYTVSLTTTTFTVRFNGGTETGDTTEDQWEIDAVLLRSEGTGSKEDAVDNDTSNVDGSADVGTLSNFDNMKTEDGLATLTEGAVGDETVWLWQEDTSGYTSTSSYETYQFWSSWTTNSTTSGTVTKIGIYVFANPGNSPQVKLGIYDDSGGRPNNLLGETNAATITGAGWLDLDIVGGGVNIFASTTYHVSHITNIAPITQWRYLKTATPVSDFRNGRVWSNLFDPAGTTTKSGSYRYGAYRVGYDQLSDYRLDQEVQWTDLPHSLPNENLSIDGGTMGDEDIKVDVWNGTGWETVFTDLSSGWNNVSITEWLTTSTFTIRFRDGIEAGDASPDTWQIDIALIHVWNEGENYVLDLEVQWTNVDFNEANEELCIYGGLLASESLRVDIWTGAEWQNVISSITNGWNNVTVSTYLVSSTLTIRFKGSIETADAAQDGWAIDATLLHVWS
jgi:hypothetical protein